MNGGAEPSLAPRPEEAEEERGRGFSRSCMRVIIFHLSTCTRGRASENVSLSHGFIADVYCLLRAQAACLLVCECHDVCDKCLPFVLGYIVSGAKAA